MAAAVQVASSVTSAGVTDCAIRVFSAVDGLSAISPVRSANDGSAALSENDHTTAQAPLEYCQAITLSPSSEALRVASTTGCPLTATVLRR